MADTSGPVLVYNRIDENRRNTVLLLPVFAVLLFPVAYGLTQLLVPFSFYGTHVTLGGAQARLDVASMEANTLRTVLLALAFAGCVALLGYRVSAYFVLRRAGGHRVDPRDEPVLCRIVENLCLGTGLPQPALYVVESSTPNAFSAGRDPRHASLVVTRGLLQLLDARELTAVLAHELSHIGNRDTDLSSLVAALVATLRLPLAALGAFVHSISTRNPLGFLIMGFGLVLVAVFVPTIVVWSMWARHQGGMPLNIREVMTIVAPLYALFIAPAAATFVRKAILHQREFLADADAVLLTRDPEGLALALAKASAATGSPVNGGVATAHFYFLDPLPHSYSWLDSAIPSHPPVHTRIALLARMGEGIPERTLLEAIEAGTAHVLNSESRRTEARKSAAGLRQSRNDESEETGGGVHHRVHLAAAFHERIVSGTRFRLTDHVTPLYEKADGWSDVALQLSPGTIVAFDKLVGNFAHVEVDGTSGYIPRIAGADDLSAEQSHA